MALKHGDLRDTMLKNISIDEFEPKTGGLRDVSTVGFYVRDRNAGNDLYRFINHSVIDTRDVELTPNPTVDGYYMVFVELDRDKDLMANIQRLIDDVENLCDAMPWQFKTHLMDDYQPWKDHSEYGDVFFTDPEDFMTVEQYQDHLEEQRLAEQQAYENSIREFFQASALEDVQVNENTVNLLGSGNNAQFQVVGFGPGQQVMSDAGISDVALGTMDNRMRIFNHMLGGMNAMPVGEYVVIYAPHDDRILVGKPC